MAEDQLETTATGGPAAAAAAAEPAAAEPVDANGATEGPASRSGQYMVLVAEDATGPWTELGLFEGSGQPAAKSAAVTHVGKEQAEKLFFVAIPISSYKPEKPTVKVVVSFS